MAASPADRRQPRVEISPDRVDAAPGQTSLVFVTVYNTSDIIEGFRVTLRGDDELRAVADPEVLSLFPDSEGMVALSIVPDRYCSAGAHLPAVAVESTVGDALVHEGAVLVQVAPVVSSTISLEPQSVTGGSRARFSTVAENHGNVPVTLQLSAQDPERALDARFSTTELTLAPSERASVPFSVRGPRPFLGAPVPRVVSVRATVAPTIATAEAPAPVEAIGTFVQRPRLPRALLTLAALLLALGLWAAVLLQGVGEAANQVAAEVSDTGTSMIVGRVTDGGAGLGGVEIVAAGPSSASATTLTAGDVGSFTLTGLQGDATYVLTLAKDGYTPITYQVPVPPGEGAVVSAGTIALGRGSATVSGTVADAAGIPLGDVTVTVRAGSAVVARASTASSGAVGFYSVAGLGAGEYSVAFERFGFTATSVQVAVEAGQVATTDAALTPLATGSITGFVSAAVERVPACGGPPACGLSGVTVQAMAGMATLTAMTLSSPAGSEGQWTLTNLPAGTYTLTFAKEGYATQVLTATLGVDQAIAVSVSLAGLPGTITGTAAGCRSVEVLHRDLSPLEPPVATAPAEDGTFTLSQLPTPGEYRLLFDGPALRTLDVDLAAGEARTVNESCQPPAAATSTTTTTTTTTAPPASDSGGFLGL